MGRKSRITGEMIPDTMRKPLTREQATAFLMDCGFCIYGIASYTAIGFVSYP